MSDVLKTAVERFDGRGMAWDAKTHGGTRLTT
jgi:hypothetical protein